MYKRIAISMLVGLALSIGAVGTASAHTMDIQNAGARAWSPHPHSQACVEDLSSDGYSARADYHRLGSSIMYSITEDRGAGYSRCSGSGNTVSLIRACTVKPLYPDACTGWAG